MSSTPPASVLRWQIPRVPAQWEVVPGWGVRGVAGNALGSNICLTEDTLLAGKTIEPYVRTQMTLLRRNFANPRFAGPSSTPLLETAGAQEGSLLLIAYRTFDGREVLQLQAYARIEMWIGIATLTSLRESLAKVRKDFEQFLGALRVRPASSQT